MYPVRCAVTTTPSIFPSAWELTIPVSAACPSAWTASIGKIIAAAAAASANITLFRMRLSRRKLVMAGWLDSPLMRRSSTDTASCHILAASGGTRARCEKRLTVGCFDILRALAYTSRREGGHIGMFTRVLLVGFRAGLCLL